MQPIVPSVPRETLHGRDKCILACGNIEKLRRRVLNPVPIMVDPAQSAAREAGQRACRRAPAGRIARA